MPNLSKLSKYLKPEAVKDGDVITFLDAGEIKNVEFLKDGQPEMKTVFEIGIEFRGEKKLYSPNATTRKVLVKAWSDDSENWKGKKAKITVVPAPNGKDMIVAKPLAEKVESTKEEKLPF